MIVDGLRHNTTITDLWLGDNKMGDEGAKHLAKLLQHNSKITCLGLHANGIGDEGALAIGTALLENKRSAVTNIILSSNAIKILPHCSVLRLTHIFERLQGNLLYWPPIHLAKYKNMASLFSYFADVRKEMSCRLMFLLADQKRLGSLSAIYKFFYQSSTFEPAVIRSIFALATTEAPEEDLDTTSSSDDFEMGSLFD